MTFSQYQKSNVSRFNHTMDVNALLNAASEDEKKPDKINNLTFNGESQMNCVPL
jgi:hypothetical protein